ncbi:hypothetical protein MON38_18290 [Hymenobacter sp. DH14]|uniref:Uncharacterized protein n=1 Tax=Hymenobacter cyanobacteriorum TaxID=2926463 RepID=A0A9X1VJK7_9BACT|nr:hypothetical protein [Hymenobacter cyanobacteriorum]MCI1189378.1 hypothetical protein [Hymenobacter cyanobacteriorum]
MFLSVPLRRLTAGLAAAVALPSCQQTCPLNMSPPPAFMLAFSTDTTETSGLGFRRAELLSAYLVRYAAADFQQPLDTLRQPSASTPLNNPKPVLAIYYSAGHPPQFAVPDYSTQSSGPGYRLVVPAANRTFDISNIVLQQAPGENRCDGYRITRREATVNGQLRDGLNTPPLLTK